MENMWKPDPRTIDWCFKVADEEETFRFVKQDAETRLSALSPEDDEYWKLITEIGIEATLNQVLRKAQDMGMEFPPREP